MDITFSIVNQTITRTDQAAVVAGSRGYLYAAFSFSDDWHGLIKTAQFKRDDIVMDMLLVNDRCTVPWELLAKQGIIQVTVFGGDLITVNQAAIPVQPTGMSQANTPALLPTPSYYAQVIKALGKPGPKGDTGPKGETGPQGEPGTSVTSYIASITRAVNTEGDQTVICGFRPRLVRIRAVYTGQNHCESEGLSTGTATRSLQIYQSDSLPPVIRETTTMLYLHDGATNGNYCSIAFTDTGFILTWVNVGALAAGNILMLVEAIA